MGSDKDRGNSFKKIYLYLLGLGLLFFGVFAMLFKTYDHPIYGYINFGEYHIYVGILFICLATVLMLFIRHKL